MLLLLVGLVFLIIGAELLVRGASRIAAGLGISPLIIGLTVVALGTSSPELAVSIKSSLSGQPAIALGNVVGSNVFNILFILGLSALIIPLRVSQQLIRIDVPLMIGLSVVVFLFAIDQLIGRLEGVLLIIALFVYLTFLFFQNRSDSEIKETGQSNNKSASWTLNAIFVVGGLILLVFGSRWLVNGAVTLAQSFGISELVISLTIIAAGTSLPEVVTSIIAAIRGERDIAVGNVVGSNILNILAVLGFSSIISPAGIEVSQALYHFDIPIMIAVALAALPIFFTGGSISRWEGGLLISYYIAYTTYLVLSATEHDALAEFSLVMLYFVIPITVISLLSTTIKQWRTNKNHHP